MRNNSFLGATKLVTGNSEWPLFMEGEVMTDGALIGARCFSEGELYRSVQSS